MNMAQFERELDAHFDRMYSDYFDRPEDEAEEDEELDDAE
jgi:hypothetical protein